ncbi:MAG: hypothetical protein J3R72DRAFT_453595 [Linnemannia gamsii]|nr:MAG: hypothetical protein J3R72DRAFT_453595 [Linnemannia gamsii]
MSYLLQLFLSLTCFSLVFHSFFSWSVLARRCTLYFFSRNTVLALGHPQLSLLFFIYFSAVFLSLLFHSMCAPFFTSSVRSYY